MRNIDKINQLVDFYDSLTNPEAMKKTLMDLKAETEEHKKYVEEVRKIRNFDHWKLEQEEVLKDKEKSLENIKLELEKRSVDLEVKASAHQDMVMKKSTEMEAVKKSLAERESAVSVLEKEREKLHADMKRVSDKEKAAEDMKTEYESKLRKLKELA